MIAPPSPTQDRTPPPGQPDEQPFLREMFREHEAGNVHQFILYFNVHDYVFSPQMAGQPGYFPLRLRDYLGEQLHLCGFDVVIYYSISGGLSYLDEAGMAPYITQRIPDEVRRRPRHYGQGNNNPQENVPVLSESMQALTYLDRLLRYTPPELQPGEKKRPQHDAPRIAVILEYLETLTPHEDSAHQDAGAAFAIQMLHRWAMDRRLRRKHMVVGLASDLGHVASILYTAASECRAYRVDLPIEELPRALHNGEAARRERSAWLEWVLRTLPYPANPLQQPGAISDVTHLATQTSGFNYDNLRDIVFYAAVRGEPLTSQLVQERKREIITAESRDLLEIIEPQDDFNCIAGYDYVKRYLLKVRDAIRGQGQDPALAAMIPKGILFLGPPGTGKSYMVAALARATGFNMVKLKNIRSMWVGESERNLNRVLDLLTGMAPVIVFVDEIDQALMARQSGGGGGDSGVERRIFQRILEFMAMDRNRGRILWIAASNRPDGIDAALLSRFDVVMPFLLPDQAARKAMILSAYPRKIGYQLALYEEDEVQRLVEALGGFSGREIDTLCRRALQLASEQHLEAAHAAAAPASAAPQAESPADAAPAPPQVSVSLLLQVLEDFRLARDQSQYRLQTLLAINTTNFYSFLPSREELPAEIAAATGASRPLDEQRLQEEIETLRLAIGQRRMAEYGVPTP